MSPRRQILRWLWLGLLLAACLTAPVQALTPPMPLVAYWQQLDDTRALVDSLTGKPAAEVLPRLRTEADTWAAITSVALPNGVTMPVDHSYLVAQLRADPPNLKHLSETLATLATAHLQWKVAHHTAADLSALTAILARPEFQWQTNQPNWLQQQWQNFWDAFFRWLRQFLPQSLIVSLDGDLLGNIITTVAAIVMVGVLLYMARGLLLDLAPETRLADGLAADEVLTAEGALKKAHALSATGDYRTAVRYLYLSALLVLDERGLLRYDRSLTNREYLKTVAHLPEVATTLAEVVDVFDRVWYGYQPLDADAFNKYAERVAQLEARR